MSLVSTEWLEQNLKNVKILDASWHMPASNRNGFEEYKIEHISNSIFFDLDKNSDQNSSLPHMLADSLIWEKNISHLGIGNNDRIIIYDNSDVLSACRCWYNFIYYGHDPKLVSVLDGGFNKWKSEKRLTSNEISDLNFSNYRADEKKEMVKNKKQIDENIIEKKFVVLDARSKERFEGKIPDPRKNVRSGSIPGSCCLPFNTLIESDKTFKNLDELNNIFNNLTKNNENLVFSCGSGVTACVLALAYSLVNTTYVPTIYDGSWAEYGKITS